MNKMKTKIFSESNISLLEHSINEWFASSSEDIIIHSQQMVYDQQMQSYVTSVIYSCNEIRLNS